MLVEPTAAGAWGTLNPTSSETRKPIRVIGNQGFDRAIANNGFERLVSLSVTRLHMPGKKHFVGDVVYVGYICKGWFSRRERARGFVH